MKRQVSHLVILLSFSMSCSLYMDLEPISGGPAISDMSPDLEDVGMDSSLPDLTELDMSEPDLSEDMEDMSTPVGWDRVFAGQSHTCALNLQGEAWCWGSGLVGELGSGNEDSVVPLKVPVDVPFVDLTLGAEFSCGVTVAGQLHCWGTLPARTQSPEPFLFDDGTWEDLKANSYHACGMRNGTLHCFGYNAHGQLGSGVSGPDTLVATPVEFEGTLVDFDVSERQTCVLIDNPDRELWCYGAELDSVEASSAGRREIPTLETYVAIVGSQDHFCVLTERGEPHCFGPADHLATLRVSGSLMEPGPFAQVQEFESITLGRSTGCGFNSEGAVLCWGGNRRGKLGRGTEQTSDEQAQNFGFLDFSGRFRSVVVGRQHTCGVTDQREILCWGEHFPSATGIEPGYQYVPQLVASADTFDEVAVGGHTTCGLTDDGRVACWGRNYPSLGLNATTHVPSPTVLGGLTATSLNGSVEFYCANTADNLKCWGNNYYGNLGNNSSTVSGVPVDLFLDGPFDHFAQGNSGACGVRTKDSERSQYCWGRRQILGFAAADDSRVPLELPDTHQDYVQFAVGNTHACGLTAQGSAFCWGDNYWGHLGNDSTSYSSGPVAVSGGLTFSEIAASDGSTCGLAGETVYCWGHSDATGQTAATSLRVPTPIAHSGPLYGISGNRRTFCGVAENGDVYCWGANSRGQAGAPRSERVGPPVKAALPGPAQLVRSGDSHSCALLVTGEIYCWGNASFYALGDGRFGMSLSPTPILATP